MEGSIGGGIMEYKFVELAKERLLLVENKATLHVQIHNKTAGHNQSGMICSGEQIIFIYAIKVTDIIVINAIVQSMLMHQNGTLQLSNAGIVFNNQIPNTNFYFKKNENDFLYTEKTGFKQTLCIIGGGHCALAFAKLMHGMDFYIKLFDERDGLNTIEHNKYVHQKNILNNYTELAYTLTTDASTYIVVMTFGYRTDDIAVRALLNKPFVYFGLLGSKKKIEQMFTEYKKEGISSTLLQRIHAPIGLPIKSKTPQEIAISIAAQIIKVKNKLQP
jgi:xanthine dehydrogenase accessory factor